jgi:hypothetical protein
MSVYSIGAVERNIFNLPKQLEGLDINTRNAYQATIVGEEAGINNLGAFNSFFGYKAGNATVNGRNNSMFGALALAKNVSGSENIGLGTLVGFNLLNGVRNILIGNETGYFLNGNNNILVGFRNTVDNTQPLSHSNISIGVAGKIIGHKNIAFGNDQFIFSQTGGVYIGNNIRNLTENNIIIGGDIENTGERVLIINNRHSSNNTVLNNSNNDYVNINDYIVVANNSSNESVMTLTSQIIAIDASNVDLNFLGQGRFQLGAVLRFFGAFATMILDSNIFIGQSTDCNSPYLLISSNNVVLGGSNVLNTKFQGSNVNFYLNSNVISLSNISNSFYLDSNNILLGGSNNKKITIYGSNNTITLSNGGTFIESELVVYRDTILSNNLIVDKTSTFKDEVDIYADTRIHSNLQLDKNVLINSNSIIYVNGNVTTCNDDIFYIKGSGETRIQQPIQLSNAFINDKISYCNVQQGHINWNNITDREVQELYGSTIVQKNLFVGGMMYSFGLNVADRLVIQSSNNQWTQYVEVTSNANPGLVFKSQTGTTVKIGDDFTTEILNFTGKHRCDFHGMTYCNDLIGRIVIANGEYCSLDNNADITIDEAIPIIELATIKNDIRAFGVISDIETSATKRIYKIGNIQFENSKLCKDIKVIVNSVGEGGIWICNANGSLKNGDLITTSEVCGFGMRQDDDIIRSCTVAKITCDCDFLKKEHDNYIYNGTTYKIAFVGCVYKF